MTESIPTPVPEAEPVLPPDLPLPPAEAARRRPSRWRRWAFLAPVAMLLAILTFVQLPYFVFEPGPTENVEALITVQGHQTYESEGQLMLTAVHLFQPNVYQLVRAWVDDAQSVAPESDFLGPDETPAQEFQRARSQMDQSQIDATFVALTDQVGYPDQHGQGVLVESTLPGSPADGKLFSGDVIESIDGRPVADVDALSIMLADVKVGQDLTIGVRIDQPDPTPDETTTVHLAPAMIAGIDHPAMGIVALDNFPFSVSIDAGGIGGPSAGLMWTLGLIDLLTPGDMTGGQIIAGTGTIQLDGTVGPIGGIAEKVAAAERAGAVIFFAPVQDAPSAEKVAGDMTIVPVSTYQQAVDYLEQHVQSAAVG